MASNVLIGMLSAIVVCFILTIVFYSKSKTYEIKNSSGDVIKTGQGPPTGGYLVASFMFGFMACLLIFICLKIKW